MRRRDPRTADEWQEACNLAAFLLLVDSARLYGLIEGGPRPNVERCLYVMARGAELGYKAADVDELVGRYVGAIEDRPVSESSAARRPTSTSWSGATSERSKTGP